MKTGLLFNVFIAAQLITLSISGQNLSPCEFQDPGEPWDTLHPLPTKIAAHTMTTLNGKIYIMGGGHDVVTWVDYNEILEYDPATDSWDSKGILAHGIDNATACTIDDRIYLFQGRSVTAGNILFYGLERYDPVTDTWETLSNYPELISYSSICVLDGMIYASGGTSDMTDASAITYRYDPGSDTWTRLADMNTARGLHVMEAVNGKIYVFGGAGGYPSSTFVSSEMYDPASDTWTPIKDLPWGMIYARSFSTGNFIYITGGTVNFASAGMNIIFRYDTENDTYEKGTLGTLPYRRMLHGVVCIDDHAYVAGGYNNDNADTSGTADLWRWDLNFIHHEMPIPGLDISDGSTLDLSEYFLQAKDAPINYTVCIEDESVVTATVDGSILHLEPLGNGSTAVTILAESGECQNGCTFEVVATGVGIYLDEISETDIELYPNPVSELLTLCYDLSETTPVSLEIYNILGKKVYSKMYEDRCAGSHESFIDVSSFRPGLYLLELSAGNARLTRTFVVK